MFMTPWESLASWVSVLAHESYLSYKKGNKKYTANYRPISLLNLDYNIYTEILKNHMQKTLDNITIISEN